jgi:glycosyltransferase involved in cell wall biosynthesis
VITVANGIDPNLVVSPWTSAEAKRRLGLPGDCPTVGTAGRLEPVKRLDLFLRMAAQISKSEPRCRFVIAGTGGREADLRSLAGSLGIADKVLFLGYRSDVWDVMRAMDMFVFSSDHEGLPMVLLEGLALGVPVVARAVGGIREVLEDGDSGILVQSSEPSQLAQACIALLAEPQRRQDLAAAGMRRLASEYSLERTAASVSRFYTDLLGKASRDSRYEADKKKTNLISN